MGRQNSAARPGSQAVGSFASENTTAMSSQRTMRRILSLVLGLSVGFWAESGLAIPSSAGGNAIRCQAAMSHAHHPAAAMPCCPSSTSVLPHFFGAPPCCDLSRQQTQPLASVVIAGKFRSGPISASGALGMMFVPPQRTSSSPLIAGFHPFVKCVLDGKTDLRI
jgi:hypothetical protein